ncbi:hypothetical protein GCM10010345_26850 [Streptomyces canarius]|uniref:Uncharacterized protein n=1 Tax=Streptomyces canarius TaxID=285453 RepID=A0ABQ3CKI0_9ACTN|nr:hypothetical protein GCM10010345_26850 [Streptomyces canarius]
MRLQAGGVGRGRGEAPSAVTGALPTELDATRSQFARVASIGWGRGDDREMRGGVRGPAVGQRKFTSLHRKYVWSMCEACQMV